MPKHVITFNLPEDAEEYRIAMNATKYYIALCEFAEVLRGRYKHTSPKTKGRRDEFTSLRDTFYRILNDMDVDL